MAARNKGRKRKRTTSREKSKKQVKRLKENINKLTQEKESLSTTPETPETSSPPTTPETPEIPEPPTIPSQGVKKTVTYLWISKLIAILFYLTILIIAILSFIAHPYAPIEDPSSETPDNSISSPDQIEKIISYVGETFVNVIDSTYNFFNENFPNIIGKVGDFGKWVIEFLPESDFLTAFPKEYFEEFEWFLSFAIGVMLFNWIWFRITSQDKSGPNKEKYITSTYFWITILITLTYLITRGIVGLNVVMEILSFEFLFPNNFATIIIRALIWSSAIYFTPYYIKLRERLTIERTIYNDAFEKEYNYQLDKEKREVNY